MNWLIAHCEGRSNGGGEYFARDLANALTGSGSNSVHHDVRLNPAVAQLVTLTDDMPRPDVVLFNGITSLRLSMVGQALRAKHRLLILHGPWELASKRRFVIPVLRFDRVFFVGRALGAELGHRYNAKRLYPGTVRYACEPIPGDRMRDVLWIGRADPVKRPDLAVGVLEYLARRNGISSTLVTPDPNVRSPHPLVAVEAPTTDALAQFSSHRLLLNTSTSESYGRAMIEALRAGRSVVATAECDLRHEFQHPAVTWVSPGAQVADIAPFVVRALASAPSVESRATDLLPEHDISRTAAMLLEAVGS